MPQSSDFKSHEVGDGIFSYDTLVPIYQTKDYHNLEDHHIKVFSLSQ
jgi:hypothetical protein